MNVSLAFTKAADYLEQRGWIQQFGHDEEGRHCGAQALWASCESGEGYVADDIFHISAEGNRVYAQASDYFLDRVGQGIIHYNDAPGRTQAEVVAKFRGLAEQYRQEHPS
jgi:hypothetical protein